MRTPPFFLDRFSASSWRGVVLTKDMTLRRVLFSWLVWSTLGALVLQTLIVLVLTPSFLHQLPNLTFTGSRLYRGSNNSLFEETAGVSQELSRECAQQSRQALASACSFDTLAPLQQRDGRLGSVPAPISLLILAFLPRKLSPPSAEDDPFLS